MLRHGGDVAEGGRTFSPLEERGVVSGGDDVGGISEFSASEEAVKLEVGENGPSVREAGNVARSRWREVMVGRMEKLEEFGGKDEGSGKVLWRWLLGLEDGFWELRVGGGQNRDAGERDDGFGRH